jgi:hypothetical protein
VAQQGLISPTCLHAAYMFTDPKSAKRQSSHKQVFFALLGSSHKKSCSKNVGEFRPKNIIKIAAFIVETIVLGGIKAF